MASVYRRKGPQASKNYRLAWTENDGTRMDRSSGTTNRREAEAMGAAIEARLAKERLGLAVGGGKTLRPDMPYREAVAALIEDCSRDKRPQTIKGYTRTLDRLGQGCPGLERLGDLTAERVEGFMARIIKAGQSRVTAANYLRRAKVLTAFCVRRGWLERCPLEHSRQQDLTRKYPRRAFTPGEFNRLVEKCSTRRTLVYRVAALSGLRRNELLRLERRDFTLGERPRWHLRAEITKGRRCDVVPMLAEAAEAMQVFEGRAPDSRIFLYRLPGAEGWAHDLAAAGVEATDAHGRVVTFHSLRYTFITALARAGVPIQHVKKLARHKNIRETADIYTDLGLDDLEDEVGELPGRLY